jgi:hypothetical protein
MINLLFLFLISIYVDLDIYEVTTSTYIKLIIVKKNYHVVFSITLKTDEYASKKTNTKKKAKTLLNIDDFILLLKY